MENIAQQVCGLTGAGRALAALRGEAALGPVAASTAAHAHSRTFGGNHRPRERRRRGGDTRRVRVHPENTRSD